MAKMIFDEEGLLEEPCLSCDKAYVEDIWDEQCCDEKVCPYKVKSEDEYIEKEIEEIEVKTTIYVTDDGERFYDLELARKHKKHIEASEKLKTFKIGGPNYTPFDDYRLLAYEWQWYKVHDHDELHQVLRLIAEVYGIRECRYSSNKCSKFPEYIGVSCNHKCIDTLTNVERKHELEIIRWKKFYQVFKNDLKKDRESL